MTTHPVWRKITAAEWRCAGHIITFDCGHLIVTAPHFSLPKLGTTAICCHCGKEAKSD